MIQPINKPLNIELAKLFVRGKFMHSLVTNDVIVSVTHLRYVNSFFTECLLSIPPCFICCFFVQIILFY